jgi:ribosomal protein S18 acetylase RimI-like enzyme
MSTATATATAARTVVKATPQDLPQVAETLGHAFFDDPVMSWCYPDADRRAQLLTQGFGLLLAAAHPHGGVDTFPDLVSGAIWVPPGAELDEQLPRDLGEVSGEYAERLFTLFDLLDRHHPTHEPHQYLFVLGTRPGWQSRGLGSALMRPVLADCDRDGVPAYLEATTERNRDLYARHGFEVQQIVTIPDGPPVWCMWRNPGGNG